MGIDNNVLINNEPVEFVSKPEVKEKINLLENSILIHGFSSNINTGNSYAMEQINLEKILHKGALATPSRRSLTPEERARYQTDAPFDLDRLTFHVWKGDEEDNVNYINEAFFAVPPVVLAGAVLHEDPAWAGRAISAFRTDGMEISLNNGLLFCSPEYALQFQDIFQELATKSEMRLDEYIRKHVVILPRENFSDINNLWKSVSTRIKPSNGVSAQIVTADQMEPSNGIDFTKSLSGATPVTVEQLGDGKILEINKMTELSNWLTNIVDRDKRRLDNIVSNLNDNPFDIETLREIPHWFKILDLLNKFNPESDEIVFFNKARAVYDQIRIKALRENNTILKLRYPNAQKSSERIRPAISEPVVFVDENGEYRVMQPL
ncbi:MAG TPA: hypothetical protein VL401_03875 [Alphaproteobacteria bacterium]|jgi:hypothetical protein|nr:hypothetical protein [Alphaproteobacteria bacterium]